MNDLAASLPLMSRSADLEREFAERLADSSCLAFRVAYGVLRHREDAEEVAQEAFARAYVRFETLRDRERFRAWLVRITWRLAIDRHRSNRRRQQREQVIDEVVDAAHDDAEDRAALRQRQERLWQAVDELPETLRSVIVLAALQGYDVREVATLLDLPEGTVKSRLFTARKRLAEALRCLASDTKKS
jgi:RNA polymerase sigma-70 factor (ECF subfamily)